MPSNLLTLLQISDSFFPVGAYTQSFGLETYVQEGLVISKEGLRDFLTAYLLESVAPTDGVAMVLAYRAASKDDLSEVIELDTILAAQKLAREGREGSVKVGAQMLRLACAIFQSPMVTRYYELLAKGRAYANHAVVFGMVGQAAGIDEADLVQAFLYSAATAMVSAAVRLVPIGQSDGQWVLKEMQEVIQRAAEKSRTTTSKNDLGSRAIALEIRGMQHERLYTRLFMS